ncbi:hypothetical protein COO91_09349 (plasmid) [Nostoc flagelliforme CCNUN1]|uniref:Uncharacterized protein n=1 Tax=Nostoc flagelliforme CCNUN1 TaxID=2038116 RepID=A0A2K8T639_9NOSO|nr:hypothetical protein COO91_09349 [Nostoc flagelliforme CCNUN1]
MTPEIEEVPLRKCNGNSIIPTVATSHQSVKRDEKEVKLVA